MPSWDTFLNELQKLNPNKRESFFRDNIKKYLTEINKIRDNTNVIVYSSNFLQKPQTPPSHNSITKEDINGFMNNLVGIDSTKGLTLIMHTPGGEVGAVEPIVGYLRSKFDYIEVIIPTYCMSAGTMITLSANKVIMGRQSQIGQIDPQLVINNRMIPATSIISQFDKAKDEIIKNPKSALAWNPILKSMGPDLIETCEQVLSYSKNIVSGFLKDYMLSKNDNASNICENIVNVLAHGIDNKNNHGRRIDRNEAKKLGIIIEDLEDNDNLQDAVLSLYHIITLLFETSLTTKIIASNRNKNWIKSLPQPQNNQPNMQRRRN